MAVEDVAVSGEEVEKALQRVVFGYEWEIVIGLSGEVVDAHLAACFGRFCDGRRG